MYVVKAAETTFVRKNVDEIDYSIIKEKLQKNAQVLLTKGFYSDENLRTSKNKENLCCKIRETFFWLILNSAQSPPISPFLGLKKDNYYSQNLFLKCHVTLLPQ